MKLTQASLGLMALALYAVAQAGSATQPSPPDSPGAIYITQEDLSRMMQQSLASHADPALATVGVTDRYAMHEVHRSKAGPPAIHPMATELHFILSGSGLLVTGGRITNASDGEKVIQGGVARTVHKGDAIIIPPNTPHWYKQVNGSLSYLEVRFVTPMTADKVGQPLVR